jgi:uncharacterized membrane protein
MTGLPPHLLAVTLVASEPITVQETALVSLSPLPIWTIVLGTILILIGLGFHIHSTAGAPTQIRFGLVLLRALLSILLIGLLLEPGIKEVSVTPIENRVVLAIDTSESMALSTAQGPSRLEVALKSANALKGQIQRQNEPFIVDQIGFHSKAKRLSNDTWQQLGNGTLSAKGNATDLLAPIRFLADEKDARLPIGGIVLFSDGADTERSRAGLSQTFINELKRIDAPIHVVPIGRADAFRDLSIEKVIYDDFAFVRNKVKIEALIKHQQIENQKIVCTLRKDGKPITSKAIEIKAGDQQLNVVFEFEPKSAGRHIYSVTLPLLPNEAIRENNRVDFTLKVIRDRIRVLQVAGQPSWDQRFVRRLLKENPSVDLISFFILRSTTDRSGAPSSALSLIPFPTRELFTEELNTFDVVIFQNFNFRPYQMGVYLQNVRKFVEESGGGFMMIGGALSFSEGDYDATPIAEILPVGLHRGPGHLNEDLFHPILTAAGETHPITQLQELGSRDNPFAGLPPLEGVNLVANVHPDSKVLLSHPYLNIEGRPHPVVATREVGRGRTIAILTDSFWNWALPHVGIGGRGDVHRRILANAIRWLIRDPALSRIQIQHDRKIYDPGEQVHLEVKTFDPEYGPARNVNVQIVLTPLNALLANQNEDQTKISQRTNSNGQAKVSFSPSQSGAWRVHATSDQEGEPLGKAETVFIVRQAKKEKLHSQPDWRLLEQMADVSGGERVPVDEVDSLDFVDHGGKKIHAQESRAIWNRLLVLVLVIGIAGAEWWWRRRKGFA